MDRYGEPYDTPKPLSVKMEELFQVALTQRRMHIDRLRAWPAPLPRRHRHMTENDMKLIFNTWRKNVDSWMSPCTLAKYNWLMNNRCRQDAQRLGKSAHSTYLFQLSGCKFLLHKLIELPLIVRSLMVFVVLYRLRFS